MTLQTDRLLLRPFSEDDFDAVHSYASNYENVKYMDWGPNTPQATMDFLHDAMAKASASPRVQYDFAVILKSTDKLIGGCGIRCNATLDTGMVGWILHKDYWMQGYGTEMARELLRFGFEEKKLHRIYATCFADNYGSYRVMERGGMRREGHFLQSHKGRPCDPEPWRDELHYGILASEWKA